jgi:hypothetical protein
MKVRPIGADLFNADGPKDRWTDGQTDILRTRLKTETAYYYAILLRHTTTAYYYDILLRHTTTTYYCSILLRHTTTANYYDILLRHTTMAYYYGILRHTTTKHIDLDIKVGFLRKKRNLPKAVLKMTN